jgi:superfamily I DNA/RNA helicase
MKIVVMDTFFYQEELRAHASQEFIIEEIEDETGSRTIAGKEYETHVLHLSGFSSPKKLTLKIPVAAEEERIQQHLEAYKKAAKADRTKWGRYFDLIEGFARIQPSFASTVTKSQGSEWDIVYVDSRDFYTARDEKQHVQYTAVTRAKKRLVLAVPTAKGEDAL